MPGSGNPYNTGGSSTIGLENIILYKIITEMAECNPCFLEWDFGVVPQPLEVSAEDHS